LIDKVHKHRFSHTQKNAGIRHSKTSQPKPWKETLF
jgi:hypothetical protein